MLGYTIVLLINLNVKWTESSYIEEDSLGHEDFVNHLKRFGYIKDKRIEYALSEVDRRTYVCNRSPYENFPNKPPIVNFEHPKNTQGYALLQFADYLKKGSRVLDVECGSGYLSAVMSILVGETGLVVGQVLSRSALNLTLLNVLESNPDLLQSGNLKFVVGDVRNGFEMYAPYDVIHVGMPFKKVPQALLDQLKTGGRMMIPIRAVGTHTGYKLFIYDKLENGTAIPFQTAFMLIRKRKEEEPKDYSESNSTTPEPYEESVESVYESETEKDICNF